MSENEKLLTYALDAALEIHPEMFSISGEGFLCYEGELIPAQIVERLEPNDFDYMVDRLIEKALGLKKLETQEVAA